MILEIITAFLFILSVLVQLSLVNSLIYPLVLFPFHFLIGLLIFHRTKIEFGVAWFILSAVVLPFFGFNQFFWWSYIIIAFWGYFLLKKLFTTRSVYALEGFGLTMYSSFIFLNVLPFWLSRVLTNSGQTSFITGRSFLISLAMLFVALYFGFLISRLLEKLTSQLILTK